MLDGIVRKGLVLARTHERIVRFILAGVVNTLVHLAVFAVLEQARFSTAWANVLAFLVANVFSFFVASYFVFSVRVKGLGYYLRFLCASLAGVAVSWGVGTACDAFAFNPYYSVLMVVLIIPPISYTMQKLVFRSALKQLQ